VSLLIQNINLIDPEQKLNGIKDVLIEDGKIKSIDDGNKIPKNLAKKLISGNGLWLAPGLIDIHVHLREPGFEAKETIKTGSQSALSGGFTSVACMANTKPVNDSGIVTSFIIEQAKKAKGCRVYPIGAVSKGLLGAELAEIGSMVEAGAVAISDDGMPVMNAQLMRRAMEYAKTFNIPVISHAEDSNLVNGGVMNEGFHSCCLGLPGNPPEAEEIMVAREIALCRLTGARVHIAHVSSVLSLLHIKRAKEEGLPITAEVTPHHLTLTDASLEQYEARFKVAPPLRTLEDTEALINALNSGVIDIIATDHAPHTYGEKSLDLTQAPPGMIGLETALSKTLELVHAKKISAHRWINALTTNPAKLLNLKHGKIDVGQIADLTLFDPNQKWTYSKEKTVSQSHNSPFLDNELTGKVKYTILEGEVFYES